MDNEDPSKLTDEELDARINGEEPAVEEPESPEVVEETPEVEEVEPEAEVEDTPEQPEEEQPDEPKPSRREQLRVQALLQKYPELGNKPKPQVQKGIDYASALEADPEIIQQLEQDRQVVSDEAYQMGLNQSLTREWYRDLKFEAPVVEEKFPFLNPRDEENFNPAAADAMSRKYLRFVGYTPADPTRGIPESVAYPNISYREFVESEMEFVDELASQKVEKTKANIAKQAATTGLRPDGSGAKKLNLNKAPEHMSDEELDAVIAQAIPNK